jgi:hypothetical protein
LQLRHTRGSNQIIALTECRERLESEDFQDARQFVARVLPELLKNPEIQQKLEQRTFPLELRPAANVANFFESMGAFVRFNIVDRNIACNLWNGVVLSSWEGLLPVIRVRRNLDPAIWENFEYFAMLSKQFRERAETSYPKGLPRMPLGGESAQRSPNT